VDTLNFKRLFIAGLSLAGVLVIYRTQITGNASGHSPAMRSVTYDAIVAPNREQALRPEAPSLSATPWVRAPTSASELRVVLAKFEEAGDKDIHSLSTLTATAEDPLLVGNALRTLSRLDPNVAREQSRRLLDDERPRVRQEAIVALGLAGDPASVADMERVLSNGSQTERSLAFQALGRILDNNSRRILERELNSTKLTPVEDVFARQALSGKFSKASDRRAIQ
jgi:hypothetical protein